MDDKLGDNIAKKIKGVNGIKIIQKSEYDLDQETKKDF